MAIEQRFTDLPSVASSQLTDIICAVQGFVDSSNPGLSTQQTLSQVLSLAQSSIILFNAGNPNGAVAGTTYQLCWDTVDNILWVCTTSGTSSTAVWTKSIELTAGAGVSISQSGSNITISASSVATNFVVVSTTSQSMAVDTTYQPNNSGLVTLSLPATASLGARINIIGFGSGGWQIQQSAGQQVIVGNVQSSVGAGGSVSSTNQYDAIALCCVVANTTWQATVAPQGSLTIV